LQLVPGEFVRGIEQFHVGHAILLPQNNSGMTSPPRKEQTFRYRRIGYPPGMFEILVNGIPRSYRDQEAMAIYAGRMLRGRDQSEITVINLDTRQWVIIRDHLNAPGLWQDPAGGPLRIVG
jgi:hypothetical protein